MIGTQGPEPEKRAGFQYQKNLSELRADPCSGGRSGFCGFAGAGLLGQVAGAGLLGRVAGAGCWGGLLGSVISRVPSARQQRGSADTQKPPQNRCFRRAGYKRCSVFHAVLSLTQLWNATSTHTGVRPSGCRQTAVNNHYCLLLFDALVFILLRNPTIGSGTRPMSPAQNKHVAQHYWKLFNNELGG